MRDVQDSWYRNCDGFHDQLLLFAVGWLAGPRPALCAGGHGISTSLTRVAVVRSATKKGSNARASLSDSASTVHQSAWPPEPHEPIVVSWRSGLSWPLNEVKTTPHSFASWRW